MEKKRAASRGSSTLNHTGAKIVSVRLGKLPDRLRSTSSPKMARRAAVAALDRPGKTLLRAQVDPLMHRFRLTNPNLYGGYRGARVIVERHGAGGTPSTPPPTPPPPGP